LTGAPLAAKETPPTPVAKPSSENRLESVEQELQRKRAADAALAAQEKKLKTEIDSLRDQLVTVAAATRTHEQAVSQHRQALASLEAEEKAKVAALGGRRHQLSNLLMALARHARRPPEALIASPSSPEDTIRAALLLAAAVPELEGEASRLKAEIDSIDTVRRAEAATRASLERESGELAGDKKRLETLVAQKSALQRKTQAQRQQAQADADRLAREAHDIKELMERIEAERLRRRNAETTRRSVPAVPSPPPKAPPPKSPAPAGTPREIASLGRPIAPVSGRILTAFGTRGEGGAPSRGIVIAATAGATVLAPISGQVVFAGPFRDYGQLLIIEHGEGYHLLLAGLGRIDSALGESVLAGEPIGIIGRDSGGAAAKGVGAPFRLYLELRHNGRPIDPTTWLGFSTDKVSG
jgi:septal ring factor EnvC (AmiA/AmiB activator)